MTRESSFETNHTNKQTTTKKKKKLDQKLKKQLISVFCYDLSLRCKVSLQTHFHGSRVQNTLKKITQVMNKKLSQLKSLITKFEKPIY